MSKRKASISAKKSGEARKSRSTSKPVNEPPAEGTKPDKALSDAQLAEATGGTGANPPAGRFHYYPGYWHRY